MESTEKRHYAIINKYYRKLTLKFRGKILAFTEEALILKEVGKTVYNPVFYVPKEDIKMELELDPKYDSNCPIKGDATYWNLKTNPTTENYFAWSYENPLPRSRKIKGYIAFNFEEISFVSEPI